MRKLRDIIAACDLGVLRSVWRFDADLVMAIDAAIFFFGMPLALHRGKKPHPRVCALFPRFRSDRHEQRELPGDRFVLWHHRPRPRLVRGAGGDPVRIDRDSAVNPRWLALDADLDKPKRTSPNHAKSPGVAQSPCVQLVPRLSKKLREIRRSCGFDAQALRHQRCV